MSSFYQNGVVTYYNSTKNFGFIITEENKKVFFNSDEEFKENQEVYVYYDTFKTPIQGKDPKAELVLPKSKNDVFIEHENHWEYWETPTILNIPNGIYKNKNNSQLVNCLTGEEYNLIPQYNSLKGRDTFTKEYYISGDNNHFININGVDYPIKNNEPIIYNDKVLNLEEYINLQKSLKEERKETLSKWEEFKTKLGINIKPQEKIVNIDSEDEFDEDEQEWVEKEPIWDIPEMECIYNKMESEVDTFQNILNKELFSKKFIGKHFSFNNNKDTLLYNGVSYKFNFIY